MSELAFDSLYYTDCRPGEGLRGGAGFQFQAVSAGVTHEVMTLVQRSALYEAPVAWMREHRPVGDYPPSLTHVYDGVYVTARGVYLGAEVNGVREGNQFTHAVSTDNPDAYGLIRPAQLWGAPWWSERSGSGTRCEPVAAEPPTAAPWGIDAVREWVLGQPEAEEWLTAVCSALDRVHDPDGRRLVFVSSDAEPVLSWISAATVLLPRERALRVSFRVYAVNPQYSQHDVLAVHPDWAGQLADPGRTREFLVFNVDTGECTPVEPTTAAAHWVPRFLAADPYDVADAVELAHQFASVRSDVDSAPARPSPADLFASTAVVLGERAESSEQAAELTSWLGQLPQDALADVFPPVAEAVLDADGELPTLRDLDRLAHRHDPNEPLTDRIRGSLVAAELTAITRGVVIPDDRTPPPHTWSPAEGQRVVAKVASTADRIDPERVDPVLRIARRYEVRLAVPMFSNGAHQFVRWWADNPARQLDPANWDCGADLVDLLRDELAGRLSGPGTQQTVEAIRTRWWSILWETIVDPMSNLDRTVASAAFARGGPSVRRKVQVLVMDGVRRSARPDAAELAWAAIFGEVRPRLEDLVWFLSTAPPGDLSDRAAGVAFDVINNVTDRKLTSEALEAVRALGDRGWDPPRGRLAAFAREDRILTGWLDMAGRPGNTPMPDSTALSAVSQPVLRVRRDDVMRVLLERLPLSVAAEVTEVGGDELRSMLLLELPVAWRDEGLSQQVRAAAVALAFLIYSSSECPESLSDRYSSALQRWIGTHPAADHRRVGELLSSVDGTFGKVWQRETGGESGQGTVKPAPAKGPGQDAPQAGPAAWLSRFGRRRG